MGKQKKIGILYICTGKYDIFWKDFFESSEKYLFPKAEKHYFIFTDNSEVFYEKENGRIHRFFQENLNWPLITLKRFHIFLNHKDELLKMDYLFFFNANIIFKETVTEEDFLPTGNERLVAIQHPGFYNKTRKDFTYENKIESKAYIDKADGIVYVAGGLNGGYARDFIEAMETMKQNIDQDLEKNIISKWHDESHWNKYLIGRSDLKILSPSYLYPEGWKIPLDAIIIVRDKNKYGGHSFLRNKRESFLIVAKSVLKGFLKKVKLKYERFS